MLVIRMIIMSEFYKGIKFLDLFELFDKIQDNIFFINDLQKFDLVTPLCTQNEQAILNFYLAEKWLDGFPKQSLILKFIKKEKKLFYLPDSAEYYYIYYHLLKAYNNYLKTGKAIYDDESQIDYYKISNELLEKKLNATKFFEIYLEKGSNFSDEDFFLAKKNKDELNEFNFTSSEPSTEEITEMSSEPVTEDNETIEFNKFSLKEKTESNESLTISEDFEPETKKEDNSQVEIEVEEINLNDEVKFESFV